MSDKRLIKIFLAGAAGVMLVPASQAAAVDIGPKDREQAEVRKAEPKKDRSSRPDRGSRESRTDRSNSADSAGGNRAMEVRSMREPATADRAPRDRWSPRRDRLEERRAERNESRPDASRDRWSPARDERAERVERTAPAARQDWATRDRVERVKDERRSRGDESARHDERRSPFFNGDRWNRDRRELDRRGHWNSRGWRNDHRYDWRGWRSHHRSLFRLGLYIDPFGLRYRPFYRGSYLGWGYMRDSYFINDPWRYRLPPAYGPYRWVRYWDDAVLVNIYTGEIVDIEYNVFW